MDVVDLLREMRRRRVFRGTCVYLVVAWLIALFANRLVSVAGFDPSIMTLLYALLAVGLALAVAFSWLFQVTRESGVKIEHDHVEAPPRTTLGVTLDVFAFGGAGVVAVVTLGRLAFGLAPLP